MQTVPISEFKARCLAMLEEVEKTGECLTIVKRGKPIALISPIAAAGYPQLALMGTVKTIGNIVSPVVPEEDWECLQ